MGFSQWQWPKLLLLLDYTLETKIDELAPRQTTHLAVIDLQHRCSLTVSAHKPKTCQSMLQANTKMLIDNQSNLQIQIENETNSI